MATGTSASSRRESRLTLTALNRPSTGLPWNRDTPPEQRPHAIPVGLDRIGHRWKSRPLIRGGQRDQGRVLGQLLERGLREYGGWRAVDRGESARDPDRGPARWRIACRGDRKSAAGGFGREPPTLSRRSSGPAAGLSVARPRWQQTNVPCSAISTVKTCRCCHEQPAIPGVQASLDLVDTAP